MHFNSPAAAHDLFRSGTQPEQPYSERQLYDAVLDRQSREFAVVRKFAETVAIKEIETRSQADLSGI